MFAGCRLVITALESEVGDVGLLGGGSGGGGCGAGDSFFTSDSDTFRPPLPPPCIDCRVKYLITNIPM